MNAKVTPSGLALNVPCHTSPWSQTVGISGSEMNGEMGIEVAQCSSREGVGPFLGSSQCIGVV